jgi:hypothetical protein
LIRKVQRGSAWQVIIATFATGAGVGVMVDVGRNCIVDSIVGGSEAVAVGNSGSRLASDVAVGKGGGVSSVGS